MENASKALLIAASILVVIILIALGMKTLNATKDTQDSVETTMEGTEMASFNNKFTSYFGNNKSAAQAKALASVVVSNNATTDTIVAITIVSPSSLAGEYTTSMDITNKVSSLTGKGKIDAGKYSNGKIINIKLIF